MTESITSLTLGGSPLAIAAALLATFGIVLVVAGVVALFRLRPLRFTVYGLGGALLVSLGAMAAMLAVGVQGYRALTREDVAAHLSVRPAGPQRIAATVRYPDGRQQRFALAGDEIYVDARILKWKPAANLLGLHTAYELDRVAGRYRDLEQERGAARTVYPLGEHKPVDLFGLRQRYAFLAPLFDAEYGSATFMPVTQAAELEVRVSTTGLLIRDVNAPRAVP